MRFDERLRRLERRLERPKDLGRPPWFDSDDYLEECREACEGDPGNLARLEVMAEAHRHAREQWRRGKPWREAMREIRSSYPGYRKACAGFLPSNLGFPRGTSYVAPLPENGHPQHTDRLPTRRPPA